MIFSKRASRSLRSGFVLDVFPGLAIKMHKNIDNLFVNNG